MLQRDVVDISAYAQRMRKRRARRLWRLLGPILCLLVMIGSIVGIAFFSYTENRRDALALSNSLIRSMNDRITARVAAYLAPVSEMVKLAAGVMNTAAFDLGLRRRTESLAFQVLKTYPQIVAFNLGFPDGNFLMVRRMSDDSFHTKAIERNRDGTQATWIRRDTSGKRIQVEHLNNDTYDPRVRPWYTGALEAEDVYWTDVYIFFTDRKPGVTAAVTIHGAEDQVLGVLSMDILLEQLSTFLAELHIGRSGRALIIDEKGRLVAMGQMDRMLKREGGELRPAMLEELEDPVLTRAFNRFRVEGHGIHLLTVDDQKIISTASPLNVSGGRAWSVLIVVPEDDLTGFVKQNTRRALWMSTVVVGLASLMVGLLIWQGLRADRNARRILENRRQFELQGLAFSELANDVVLSGADDNGSMARLTEIVNHAAGARRTSVWRAAGKGARLICQDAFDRESGGHTQGMVLRRHDFPDLFEAIFKGDEIVLSDAGTDPRTAELHRSYLNPLGCHTLLALPIRLNDETAGGLWFEGQSVSRIWSSNEIIFARAVAGLTALRLTSARLRASDLYRADIDEKAGRPIKSGQETAAAGAEHNRHVMHVSTPGLITGGRTNRFYERLAARGLDDGRLAAEIFPHVTVFVLRFTDHLTLAQRVEEKAPKTAQAAGRMAVINHLVSHLEDLATAHGLDYLKIMSDEIIGATGFDDQSDGRARQVADLTLGLQDQCRHVFADLDVEMDFRIGIDSGPVIGSTVGEKRNYYNLWGDAVRTATMLADDGVLGAIQVSQTAYRRLRSEYVFKKRGTFYLEDTGEIETYLLTGHL